jgi:hypothetical protein
VNCWTSKGKSCELQRRINKTAVISNSKDPCADASFIGKRSIYRIGKFNVPKKHNIK